MTGPSHVHWFIHSFVCSFVYSFIHSFVCSFFHLDHNQIPFIIAYIERRQAEIDLIVSLAANESVDSLAFHHFVTEQGEVSWRNHPASKIWIVVHWKKVTRDRSDCCTLYKVSSQWYYGSTALLGWKRSNVLFSPCTFSDVTFIRLGMYGEQKSADYDFKLRGCLTLEMVECRICQMILLNKSSHIRMI